MCAQDEEIVFDPHDVSHVDAEDDDDDDDQANMVVKVADSKLAAAGASRNRRAVDDDPELEESQVRKCPQQVRWTRLLKDIVVWTAFDN